MHRSTCKYEATPDTCVFECFSRHFEKMKCSVYSHCKDTERKFHQYCKNIQQILQKHSINDGSHLMVILFYKDWQIIAESETSCSSFLHPLLPPPRCWQRTRPEIRSEPYKQGTQLQISICIKFLQVQSLLPHTLFLGGTKCLPFNLSVDTFCKTELRKLNGLPRQATGEAGRHFPDL